MTRRSRGRGGPGDGWHEFQRGALPGVQIPGRAPVQLALDGPADLLAVNETGPLRGVRPPFRHVDDDRGRPETPPEGDGMMCFGGIGGGRMDDLGNLQLQGFAGEFSGNLEEKPGVRREKTKSGCVSGE